MTAATHEVASLPDMKVSIRQLFGFDLILDMVGGDYVARNYAAAARDAGLPAPQVVLNEALPRLVAGLFACLTLARLTGTQIADIPYRGAPQVNSDLLAGRSGLNRLVPDA